jgi:voltage-gated potassium channel
MKSLHQLKSIIEDTDTRLGQAFDLFIQTLIIISLISFTVETLPNLAPATQRFLYWVEVITVAIFSIEYLARLVVADNKIRFCLSFWGLIDLIAVLPFYISTGIDLRSIRTIRILRMFRTLKLIRYNSAVQRYFKSFARIKEELAIFAVITAIILLLSATGIYYFERDAQPELFQSIPHSLWWAVTTLSTVGYGDQFPVTTGGRIFTSLVVLVGIGVVAIPSALLASAITTTMGEEKSNKPFSQNQ